jgi:hypothetical protein
MERRRTTHKLQVMVLLLLLTIAHPLQAAEFILFYANDVLGETELCG